MLRKDFQELSTLINEIIEIIGLPTTNTIYSEWDKAEDAINELSELLARIKRNDMEALRKLVIIFLPTGSLQELSISSGWGEHYLVLSNQFDRLVAKYKAL